MKMLRENISRFIRLQEEQVVAVSLIKARHKFLFPDFQIMLNN
jgi:hypothetical protein